MRRTILIAAAARAICGFRDAAAAESKLLAILAAASLEIYAEGATRRLVISIPDRKVARSRMGLSRDKRGESTK
jgi:hypothetical protein